jgi:hypothetical protein
LEIFDRESAPEPNTPARPRACARLWSSLYLERHAFLGRQRRSSSDTILLRILRDSLPPASTVCQLTSRSRQRFIGPVGRAETDPGVVGYLKCRLRPGSRSRGACLVRGSPERRQTFSVHSGGIAWSYSRVSAPFHFLAIEAPAVQEGHGDIVLAVHVRHNQQPPATRPPTLQCDNA